MTVDDTQAQTPTTDRLFGKYRGLVVNTRTTNQDQADLGMLEVRVPDALGSAPAWAMPCVPYAGPGVGFFFLPPVGASVWVEFERGDPNSPVWSGCFWEKGQAPVTPATEQHHVLRTDVFRLAIDTEPNKHVVLELDLGTPQAPKRLTLTLNQTAITLSVANGPRLSLTETAIELVQSASSRVTLSGNQVELKNGAGVVTITADAVALKRGSAEVGVAATGVALKNGAPNIQVSSNSVSINNGALEVR
jgi:Type VI secretion system/phage-baseplate injector OB domain